MEKMEQILPISIKNNIFAKVICNIYKKGVKGITYIFSVVHNFIIFYQYNFLLTTCRFFLQKWFDCGVNMFRFLSTSTSFLKICVNRFSFQFGNKISLFSVCFPGFICLYFSNFDRSICFLYMAFLSSLFIYGTEFFRLYLYFMGA